MNVLMHSFDWSGTASRREYWTFVLLASALVVTVYGIELLVSNQIDPVRATYVAAGILFLPLASVTIRRLHDTAQSGWWLLVNLIPYIGGLVLLYFMVAAPRRSYEARWQSKVSHKFGIVFVSILAIIIGLHAFFATYWIPASSMKPTLLVGDYLVATRPLSLNVARGDVLVFRHPRRGEDYVKRLIGLPGDKVQVNDGVVYINGEMVPQESDGIFSETYGKQGPTGGLPRCQNRGVGFGGTCEKQKLIETLPSGPVYSILNIDETALDNTQVYTVPEGEYFFMGDNRDNSADGRVPQSVGGVGFVPFENLIGRADRVIFSSSGRSMLYFWTWRGDRFFKALN